MGDIVESYEFACIFQQTYLLVGIVGARSALLLR